MDNLPQADLSSRLHVVLVRPEHPVNVGSCARALRNFGSASLHLVAPSRDPRQDSGARAAAHGSHDVLDGAIFHSDLAAALSSCVLAVGTTNRRRRNKLGDVFDIGEALDSIVAALARGPVAVVFGPESSGLTDLELASCSRLVRIPSAVEHPSLNLAQAVLVVVREIWTRVGSDHALPRKVEEAVSLGEWEELQRRVEGLMRHAGFRPYADDPAHFRMAFRRLLERASLERRDLRLLMLVVDRLARIARSNQSSIRGGGGPRHTGLDCPTSSHIRTGANPPWD